MAVALRLFRLGKKNNPVYRVVAMDKRLKRNGAYLEVIGTYNPMVEPHQLTIKKDRLEYWLNCGAQVSEGLDKLMKKVK